MPVELLEVTGLRERDADAVLGGLRTALGKRFDAQPRRRRIVVWSDAGRLAEEAPEEYDAVREWLDRGVAAMQHPWKLPMVGQVGVAVLQDALQNPDQIKNTLKNAKESVAPIKDNIKDLRKDIKKDPAKAIQGILGGGLGGLMAPKQAAPADTAAPAETTP